MATSPITPAPAPVTAAPAKSAMLTFLNIFKFTLPVGAAIATILLHNKTTAMQVNQITGIVESGLGNAPTE